MVSCIVIDDDQDIVNVFCDLLSIIEIDVLATANDGKDAVKLYEMHKPDIIFTDLQMPKYDGFYVVENIKEIYPDAKLVVITGNLNSQYANLFSLLHVPVINKPFEIDEIKQTLTDVFNNKDTSISPFEIKYQFKDDLNFYTCTVTYLQYRNLKKLPVIQNCEIIDPKKNLQFYHDEMQKALDLAMKNDTSHIRKLSEIVTK